MFGYAWKPLNTFDHNEWELSNSFNHYKHEKNTYNPRLWSRWEKLIKISFWDGRRHGY